MERLKIGEMVKIRREAHGHTERFWLIVEGQHDDGRYQGRVNNNLVFGHDFNFGDSIDFQAAEVLDRMQPLTPEAA